MKLTHSIHEHKFLSHELGSKSVGEQAKAVSGARESRDFYDRMTELSLLSLLFMILSDRNDKSDRTVTLQENEL